jgi:hypothetical protein
MPRGTLSMEGHTFAQKPEWLEQAGGQPFPNTPARIIVPASPARMAVVADFMSSPGAEKRLISLFSKPSIGALVALWKRV